MSSIHDPHPSQFPVLIPTLQIGFYSKYTEAQSEYLLSGLLSQVNTIEFGRLDQELITYAGDEKLRYLARHGLRGELLYPVPYLLTQKPSLIGYYRLLLGFSQKEFYNSGPFGMFSRMESQNLLTSKALNMLPALCSSLVESGWILVNGIPVLSQEILNALTLLTLGGQFRGSYNTLLGQNATKVVFETIREIVKSAIEDEDNASISVRNAAGRIVRIEFAPDPDIAIREQLTSGRFKNRIAIEIKGGKDVSNIHNRLGEAEKSHQKAKEQGFTQFWTMVNVEHLNSVIARRESPTTTAFFPITCITVTSTSEYADFKELLLAELGLKGE